MMDRSHLADLRRAEERRFVETHPRSSELAGQARGPLLAGVPMPWMTRWPGAFPIFVEDAVGATCTDVDGHSYVDFCLGDTGAMTGHGLPQVADAVARQARRGVTTMLPTADAVWVGEELHRRFGLPFWQMAMTATDANRFVLRFAREVTGRPKVLVFDWCYHGTVDEALATLDANGRVIARPGSIGPQVDPAAELVELEARFRAQVGDKDDAIRLLGRWLASNPQGRAYASADERWWWDPVRDDPRYKALVGGGG